MESFRQHPKISFQKKSISKTKNELADITFIPNFEDLTKTIRAIISAEKKESLVTEGSWSKIYQ